MEALKEFLNTLKKQGFRNTAGRTAILQVILKSRNPVTYENIRAILSQQKISMDKSTVYRELSFLTQQGIINELNFKTGGARYEMAPHNHHHHIVCVECNNVDHVEVRENFLSQEKKISKDKKFKVLQHSLDFYGVCNKCQ